MNFSQLRRVAALAVFSGAFLRAQPDHDMSKDKMSGSAMSSKKMSSTEKMAKMTAGDKAGIIDKMTVQDKADAFDRMPKKNGRRS